MSNVIEFILEAKDEFSKVMQGFQLEMSKSEQMLAKLAITGAIYATGRAAKASLDSAEAMGVMAIKANMTTEAFSALNYAAGQSDVETGSLTVGMKMLSKAMGDTGASPATDQLKSMGIATRDASGEVRSTIDVLMQVSDQFANSKDNASKTTAAMAIFGRSGADMVPMLNQGSEAIEKMMGDAEKLGIVIGDDFSKSANQVNDNLSTLSSMLSGTMNEAMKQLAPTIEQVTGDLILFGTEGSGISSIGEIIATAFKGVTTAVVAASVALGTTGKIIGAVFAAVAAAARGDFSEAGTIIKESMIDAVTSVDSAQTSIAAMWDGTATSAAASAAAQQAAARKIQDELKSTSDASKKAEEAANKRAEENAKANDKTIAGLEKELSMFGESEASITLYDMAVHNATASQMDHAAALLDTLDALNTLKAFNDQENQAATDRLNARTEQESAYNDLLNQQAVDRLNQQTELDTILTDSYNQSLTNKLNATTQYTEQITAMVSNGIGQATASALVDGKSLAAGLEAMLKNVAKTVIATYVQQKVERLILSKAIKTAELEEGAVSIYKGAAAAFSNAYASIAAIPIVGPILAPIAAVAAGYAVVQGGKALIGGAAHGGLDYVPSESTFLLDKGERVLSPRQNMDLTNYLATAQGSSSTTENSNSTVVIEKVEVHILENATNVDAFTRMDKIQLRNTLGQPIIDTLNEMFRVGVRPDFAGQLR